MATLTAPHGTSTMWMAMAANAGYWPTGTTTVPTWCVTPAVAGPNGSTDLPHRPKTPSRSEFRQPPREVGLDVACRLQAGRHTQQTFPETGRFANFRGQSSVRGTGRMRNRGLGIAEIGRNGD